MLGPVTKEEKTWSETEKNIHLLSFKTLKLMNRQVPRGHGDSWLLQP